MHSQQAQWTIELVSIVRKKLNAQILCPNQGIFDKKSLNLARITSLKCPKNSPFVDFDRVSIRSANAESAKHGAEELEIGQNDCVNFDVLA